ncbi:MAG: ribose-5-phosphate isomerase [Aeromicrobium sp.]|uniref:ribose-5-phosphate isomerase n=1 Tax=Aeromicrobium sp. TaxID=1871063 RepID=UPI0025B93D6D|nr:ribose-5-phosphate isomerase [Aeromicrobium sp.]MCK5890204.1 ribose-5-phosphate isomerase [Aeromicrobium sp.]MDF1703752.1 ribose-5-phosphate isomerase [Aeromicrobium sp.]
MRVHVAADHAGFELKTHLLTWLADHGYEPVDHGAFAYDALDDYPPFCVAAAEGVAADPGSLGIVIGGSGNGEQIAANKVTGIRAALAWSTETASLARQHNNAQVVSIGARMHSQDEATAIVETFLTTPWSDEARHQRRIDLLLGYETTGTFPDASGPGAGA